MSEGAGARGSYGVDAELELLLRCPECRSARVRTAKRASRGYGVLGFKALGEIASSREVTCRDCGAEWVRPPIRELRQEAERRIDARYAAFDAENARLRQELSGIRPPPVSGEERPTDL